MVKEINDMEICPDCGGEHLITKLRWWTHYEAEGDCLDCGYTYYTKSGVNSLAWTNMMRKGKALPPLEKLEEGGLYED